MQDLKTGKMVSLDVKKELEDITARLPTETEEERMKKAFQQAAITAIPDKLRRGPIFEVGEVLEVKGGMFRVDSIGEEAIILTGCPGTKWTDKQKTKRKKRKRRRR